MVEGVEEKVNSTTNLFLSFIRAVITIDTQSPTIGWDILSFE
jgi:hypothetical protein